MIADNAALRIQIKEIDGKPYQYFIPDVKYELSLYDFSKVNNSKQYAKKWMQKRFFIPFELDYLLFDFAFIKVRETKHFLLKKLII